MMRLLLVRHGQTEENNQGRIQGQLDVPLNDQGREQAGLLRDRLAQMNITGAYASPLARARETAEIVLEPHGVEPTLDPRLMEFSYGVWQGMTWAEVQTRYPLAFAEWAVDRERAPEGAETVHQVKSRVHQLQGEIRSTHRDGTVLVVTHGGPLRLMLCCAFGIPVERAFDMAIDNTAISELSFAGPRVILRRHNDTGHLG